MTRPNTAGLSAPQARRAIRAEADRLASTLPPLRERKKRARKARALVVASVREKGRARLDAFRAEAKRKRAELSARIKAARSKLRTANRLAVVNASERELIKLAKLTQEIASIGAEISELRALARRTKSGRHRAGGMRRAEQLGEWWGRVEDAAEDDPATLCVVRRMRRPGALGRKWSSRVGRADPAEFLSEYMQEDSSHYADCLAQVEEDWSRHDWDDEEREWWEANREAAA